MPDLGALRDDEALVRNLRAAATPEPTAMCRPGGLLQLASACGAAGAALSLPDSNAVGEAEEANGAAFALGDRTFKSGANIAEVPLGFLGDVAICSVLQRR